jgi:DNA-binding NarL/FixJ family response regulator
MTVAAIESSSSALAGDAAIAICAADRPLRDRLARLARENAGHAVAGTVGDPAALTRLLEQTRIALVLADRPTAEQLRRWTSRCRDTAFIAIIEETRAAALDLVRAGARALLSRSADDAAIAAAMAAVQHGLCVLPQGLIQAPPSTAEVAGDPSWSPRAGEPALTARELEVLAALADGLSNKAIARRLGISLHTAKFHVGGILAKLDADSRTEAVTRAAQRGLVLL